MAQHNLKLAQPKLGQNTSN